MLIKVENNPEECVDELRKPCLHTLQPPSISKRRGRDNNIWEESRNAKGQVPTGGPTRKGKVERQQYRTHYLWQAWPPSVSHTSRHFKKMGGVHVQIGRSVERQENGRNPCSDPSMNSTDRNHCPVASGVENTD